MKDDGHSGRDYCDHDRAGLARETPAPRSYARKEPAPADRDRELLQALVRTLRRLRILIGRQHESPAVTILRTLFTMETP